MTTVQETPKALALQTQGLEPTEAKSLISVFEPFSVMAKEWADKANAIEIKVVDDVNNMNLARLARLKLKNIRVEADKTRKQLKEESLRRGKAIDGMYNVIKFLIVPIEEELEKKEKYAEELENKRKQELKQKRIGELSAYDLDTSFYDLANMPEETYQNLLKGSAEAYTLKKEAEKKAEQDRIEAEEAERKEQERIRKENERLKKEADERAKKEEEEQKKREEEEAKRQAEIDKEREAREKVEAELEAKRLEEEAKKKEERKRKRQEKLAPDKDKLIALAQRIDTMELPELESEEAKELLQKTITLLSKTSKFIRTEATTL